MVALAGARGVHERGAVRGQRRGHEDKDHEEEAEELFHISITTKDTISETAGKKQEVGSDRFSLVYSLYQILMLGGERGEKRQAQSEGSKSDSGSSGCR